MSIALLGVRPPGSRSRYDDDDNNSGSNQSSYNRQAYDDLMSSTQLVMKNKTPIAPENVKFNNQNGQNDNPVLLPENQSDHARRQGSHLPHDDRPDEAGAQIRPEEDDPQRETGTGLAAGHCARLTSERSFASMSISRRRFLEGAAIGGIATGLTAAPKVDKDHKLPTRVLGKTGARVSVLAFGGGSRFLMYKEEDKALEAVNRALDLGITYMDTAYCYGNGLSEERIGKVMKTRRKGIFVATKINKRDGDEASACSKAA